MCPRCSQVIPGRGEGAACPGTKEPTSSSGAIWASTSLPFFLLETPNLPDERQDIKVPCALPWLAEPQLLITSSDYDTDKAL